MNESAVGTPFFLSTVDDYLGPGTNRFFGAGYRRVRYRARDVIFTAPAPGRDILRAAVEVGYPRDWSRKSQGDLRPHLSTIDALILGVRAAELCAALAFGLGPADRTATRPRQVDIKAAGAPVEDGLDSVLVDAVLRGTAPDLAHPAGRGGVGPSSLVVSTFVVRVASMRVQVALEHRHGQPGLVATGDRPLVGDLGQPHAGPADQGPGLAELLGVGGPDSYGPGFARRRPAVEGVLVDVARQRATANVRVLTEPAATAPATAPAPVPAPPAGPASLAAARSGPAPEPVSMIDAFVVALQLGQILLYETDQLTRAASSTLWMRHTRLTAPVRPVEPVEPMSPAGGPPPVVGSLPATAWLSDARIVDAAGGPWRTASIESACHGVGTRCAVAHRLPATPAQARRATV